MLYFEVSLSRDEVLIQNSTRLMGIIALNFVVFLSIIEIIYSIIALYSSQKYLLLKLINFFFKLCVMGYAWPFWYSPQDCLGLFNLLFPSFSALHGRGGMTVHVQKWMFNVTTSKPISYTEFPLSRKVYFDQIDKYVCVCICIHI